MRRTNTAINPARSRAISEAGHTDLVAVVVTDAALPIPACSERIDLADRPGAPAFLDVLDTVLVELVVEGARVSTEVAAGSRYIVEGLRERFAVMGFEIELVPHVEFKRRAHSARAFVRAGEFAPSANVILQAGVAY
jgi:D-ribose pyranase